MKAVFSKFVVTVLVVSAVVISGCSGSGSAESGPGAAPGASPANISSSGTSASSGNSGYPKLASSVATAEIKGLDGVVFNLNDKAGKVMLVNLWATWCGPCRFEIPALVKMQERHGPQGFEVLGLNTDDEEVQAINDFSTGLSVNYPMAYADTKLQAAMLKISKFPGIPQSFLIDRDGRLRGVFRGANPADIRKMEEVVAKVVNESPGSGVPASESEPLREVESIPGEPEEPKEQPSDKKVSEKKP